MMNSTNFKHFYEKFMMEDMTSMGALGPNSQLYSDLAAANSDTYAPGDARVPKVLNKKILRRTTPQGIFLTGKTKKNKKSNKVS